MSELVYPPYGSGTQPSPIMCRDDVNENLLKATSFQLYVPRIPELRWFVQRAQLPGFSIGETDQKSPFAPKKYPGGSVNFEDLNVDFLLDENLLVWRKLWEWNRQIVPVEQFSDAKAPAEWFGDIYLVVLTAKSNPQFVVRFKDCWPKAIGAIQFDYGTTSIDPISYNVTFSYTTYDLTSEVPNFS